MTELPTAPAPAETFERLPLLHVRESTTNPRRNFNPTKLAELTESVREKGVVEPIIVRPLSKPEKLLTHEVVAGARRYRASKAAGRPDIPAIIRNYTDAEALEVQLVENLNREDVHPLEEADGFATLLKQPNYTTEVLGQKIGHPEKYITQRLALRRLVAALSDDFLRDKINIGHAQLLCRLPPEQQDYARKNLLYKAREHHVPGRGWVRDSPVAVRVGDLDAAIKSQIFLDLAGAPWKKDDATLVPKAGACIACPKRTGANGSLFDDLQKGDNCLDPPCFGRKAEAHLVRVIEGATAAGEKVQRLTEHHSDEPKLKAIGRGKYELVEGKQKKCDRLSTGVFVDGPRKAQKVVICADGKCKVHHPHFNSGNHSKPVDFWTQRAQKLESTIKVKARHATVKAILARPHNWDIPVGALQVLALGLLGSNSTNPAILGVLEIPGLKAGNGMDTTRELEKVIRLQKGVDVAHLARICTALALEPVLSDNLYEGGAEAKRLPLAAEAFGVDQAKITADAGRQLRADFKARRDRAMERKAAESSWKGKPKQTSKAAPRGKAAAKPAAAKTATRKKVKK